MLNATHNLMSIAAALRAGVNAELNPDDKASEPGNGVRFITISRQSGAGGKRLAEQLIAAINARSPIEKEWRAWDQDLIDIVSKKAHIDPQAIAELEDVDHPWFAEFLSSMGEHVHTSDFRAYRHVAVAIRALAMAGRAILVGRGGVFITDDLPDGLHLRLVAPRDNRVARMAAREGVDTWAAATKVDLIDRNRDAFYRRYWPNKKVEPESFTLTINTAQVADYQIVDMLMPLILAKKLPPTPKPVAPRVGAKEHCHGNLLTL